MTAIVQEGAREGAQPIEIRIRRAAACLEVDFDDGMRAVLPAEYLRVESPSAAVQGHGPGQRVWVSGKAGVNIARVDPVGRYAVRIVFSDGHDTGLYPWTLLHRLETERPVRWAAYLEALASRGLSREAPALPGGRRA